MRTRRQDRIEAAEAEADAAGPATPAPQSPAVVSITKIEGPTAVPVKRNKSKLPALIQFPLVVILNTTIASLGYSLTHQSTKAVLVTHARVLDSLADVGILMGWKVFELGLGWFGNYDVYDLAALNLLSYGPPLYLLAAFYNTPPSALILSLIIEMLSTALPFALLRPLSTVHADPSSSPNAEVLTDKPVALLTTLLSGAIYSVVLYAAYATYLPMYLVLYFKDLPSVTAAHDATYLNLMPVTLALGLAATLFIFVPAVAEETEKPEPFDPATATLKETVGWNLWGWTKRTKVVITRTAVLMFVSGVNTVVQTALAVEGAEAIGAIAWASVWVLAAAFTGIGLGAVGNV